MHSIRFKITAITIVAILTTILCVNLASFSFFRTESDRQSVEMMNLIGRDTEKSLEKYTESIEQSVEFAANIAADSLDSVELAQGGVIGASARHAARTPKQVQKLDSYLASYSKHVQEAFGSVAGHTQGVVTYYYCITPQISTSEHGFFYSKVGKAGFIEREQLDARELDPNDIEHTTWYYTPIKRGRPSWVGPYTAHFLDEMLIDSYLVPIYKSGALIGVLGMDIPVETLVEQVSSIKVYDTGFACLMDAEGHILYHPEKEQGSMLDVEVSTDIFQQHDSGDQLIRYTSNGQYRQMSFTTLSNDMKLAIVAPVDEVNASSTQMVRSIVPIVLVIVAIFAAIIMLSMRFITRPLQQLTSAAQRLAAADYDVELNYKSKDEVGALTNAFKRMRDQLKANIDDLNRKVHFDDLTGLPNQRYFFELAEAERDRLLDAGKSPVMLFFNLTGMKHFNRKYGFDEGDRLIREVGQVLARTFGDHATARFGQDHFAAVACEEGLEERLENVFSECRDVNGGKTLTINVGIYPNSLEEVGVSAACDRAKYACDRRRGSYVSGYYYFTKDMVRQNEMIRHVINHLDEALQDNWIKVHYQPIVRAANGRVCDEEALSRWVDPELGLLSPADFIPALEDAGLIYKLDLYVLDQALEKIRFESEAGLTIVPHSINLSRSDFDACDIVEEICKRVDAAGIDRSKITIEITESIIGSDFEFMKGQVERFQSLGFPVWMDDFGSGYSSLDVLQSIQFDLIKFDMSFLRKLDEGDEGKIILTELVKMANGLGVDTICEGVETESQSRFLQEIGCSKLQGYYYCKAIPLSEIIERYSKGAQIGYENPEESDYYEAIGKVNLYDLTVVASEDEGSFQNVFDTLPMGILEISDTGVEYVRTNRSYRDFIKRYFGFDLSEQMPAFEDGPNRMSSTFLGFVQECCEKGTRGFFDEKMPDGTIVHSVVKRIGTNPVTGTTAIIIAVLSIAEENEGATYASIARALAVDYYNIYYVDLDTEQFIEYTSPVGGDELAVERHGEHFFEETKRVSVDRIYEDDRETFLAGFTKENIIRELDEHGVYTASYRLIDTGTPMQVNMKITRMEREGSHIIIGISIADS